MVTTVLVTAVALLWTAYGRLNRGPHRWHLATDWDARIPLVKVFVIPYVSAAVLAPVTVAVLLWWDPALAASTLLSAAITLWVSCLFYRFAQTHVPRPEVPGHDVFSRMLRKVYQADQPYNCFPSLHNAFAVIISVSWLKFLPWMGVVMTGWCGLIIASTLLVRQHYVADLLGGVGVACAACFAAQHMLPASLGGA
ncbi:phosphatase PAP2 family protein [Actinocorallia longicatena]|uniref:Inositolphosphotransferase Aur1/Ipt1 domain-containing protein n=1 Tax=Actinocorallia longicatena TaxID=111803 RepID=A0ABP6QCG3_9ACTN